MQEKIWTIVEPYPLKPYEQITVKRLLGCYPLKVLGQLFEGPGHVFSQMKADDFPAGIKQGLAISQSLCIPQDAKRDGGIITARFIWNRSIFRHIGGELNE
jgi:hypothetical protein